MRQSIQQDRAGDDADSPWKRTIRLFSQRGTPTATRFTIALDGLRIFVGVALLARGMVFLQDTSALLAYIQRTGSWVIPSVLEHYVVLAHLGGGALLALGLLTRFATLIQLPALVGAVFFVHFGDGLLSHGQSLELSALVLALLIVFAATGSGTVALDAIVRPRSDDTDSSLP